MKKSLYVYIFLFITACTFPKSTLESGPLYKVGDSFGVSKDFYLGPGTARVTAVLYGACSTPKTAMGWVYYATMKNEAGQVLEDVEICESELE